MPEDCAGPLLLEAGGAERVEEGDEEEEGAEVVLLPTALDTLEAAEETAEEAEETADDTADDTEEETEEAIEEADLLALEEAPEEALLADVAGALEDSVGAVTVTPADLQVFSTAVMTVA